MHFQLNYEESSRTNEWNDLSGNPKYESIKKRLLKQLRKWQVETGDPFIDKSVAKRFRDEIIDTDLKRVKSRYHEYMVPPQNGF